MGQRARCYLSRLEREGQPLRAEGFATLHFQKAKFLARLPVVRGALGCLGLTGWRCGAHNLGRGWHWEGAWESSGLISTNAGLAGLFSVSAWVSDPKGLAGLSGRPAGSGVASEACWRAVATEPIEKPS